VVIERILVDRFIYRGLPRYRRRRAATSSDRDKPITTRMEMAQSPITPVVKPGNLSAGTA
jgi:hypothetical protein